MQHRLSLYNTLTRQKDLFTPLQEGHVGLYVCGPTLYNYVHLGNCRTFMSFDVLYRYLLYLGNKVRYVRNITDVGHLESDADSGEDKVSKRARLEQLEPMEIVQKYLVDFHRVMEQFNTLSPSIEPTATGHIIEQIEFTRRILDAGYAYEHDGSVYFDVEKFAGQYPYTQLSGRNLDELLNNTRDLDGQGEKKGRLDFALWKKAKPEHIMRWNSPWGEGFPGWHIECSAMSLKYLGAEFDIHGGGMDLAPTHHTNEIAQHAACYHHSPARVWMHTNMLTVNGQKMSKSLGNSFLPAELFSGSHELLTKGYSPMNVRFFMLQAHYRSTLDFSNDALQAAEKGLHRLMAASALVPHLPVTDTPNPEPEAIHRQIHAAMDDDLNTPIALAHLFDAVRLVNSVQDGKASIDASGKTILLDIFHRFIPEVLGLIPEADTGNDKLDGLMQMILQTRTQAKARKDFQTADYIRDELLKIGFEIQDGKDGTRWTSR